MSCHAQFALATNEIDMKNVFLGVASFFPNWLYADDSQRLLAMDLKSAYDSGEMSVFFPTSDYWFKLERYGETYVLLWELWGGSSSNIQAFKPIFEALPKGEYGFAYAFTWDFEPEQICINADEEVFKGGGGTSPECLADLGSDYFDLGERRKMLKWKHWRVEDMASENDLNQVAMATALRMWSKDGSSGKSNSKDSRYYFLGSLSIRFEFIGCDEDECAEKSKSLRSFLLKKRREMLKQVDQSFSSSMDKVLRTQYWLATAKKIYEEEHGQSIYCGECEGENVDLAPFLTELEEAFPDVSYIVRACNGRYSGDPAPKDKYIFKRSLQSRLFPGSILSTRNPCGGGIAFIDGMEYLSKEHADEITSIIDGYRRAHMPLGPHVNKWTWLTEETGGNAIGEFQTKFAVPGTADAFGEVLGAIAERVPEVEIYGRVLTAGSLEFEGDGETGAFPRIASYAESVRYYWSPAGFRSIGWNEDGVAACSEAFASHAEELTEKLLSQLPRVYSVSGRGAKLRSQMAVGDHVVMQMNIDSHAGDIGSRASGGGNLFSPVGGTRGKAPSFSVTLRTEEGKMLGKVAFDREESLAVALNMRRLSAEVVNLDSFEIELRCVDPQGSYDFKPLFVFKKSNDIFSV